MPRSYKAGERLIRGGDLSITRVGGECLTIYELTGRPLLGAGMKTGCSTLERRFKKKQTFIEH